MHIVVITRYGKFAALAAVLMLAAVLLLAAPSFAAGGTGSANFLLGVKALDDHDWEPLEDQGELGVEVTFGRSHWPILIAIDLLASGAEDTVRGVDLEGSTSELDIGVRRIWELKRFRPYVGGGIGVVTAELQGTSDGVTITDDDSTVGAWVGGGIYWRLGTRFNLGIAARYSKAEVTIFDTDAEAGGIHAAMLLGWGWPVYK